WWPPSLLGIHVSSRKKEKPLLAAFLYVEVFSYVINTVRLSGVRLLQYGVRHFVQVDRYISRRSFQFVKNPVVPVDPAHWKAIVARRARIPGIRRDEKNIFLRFAHAFFGQCIDACMRLEYLHGFDADQFPECPTETGIVDDLCDGVVRTV